MATLLGSLLISLGLDSGQFKSGLSQSERDFKRTVKSIEATGQKMRNVGLGLSAAISVPFAALIGSSIPAARQSAEALGQVNAALASMGPVAGRTSEQLQKNAEALMNISTFDDDDILRKVTANMLTFGKVAGTEFDRAQLAAVNLSARLGTDLQSSAIMVGKALNDPVKGLTAMGKAGIQFTAQQKAMIAGMVAVGDSAGAQRIILKELESQFGGSAEAMRAASPDVALTQKWDTLKEKLGAIALDVLPKILPSIERVIDAFNNLSPGTQAVIVGVAGVAAAAGPLLTVLGSLTSIAAPLIATFGGAGLAGTLAALAVPLGIVAAAAGAAYLVWKNWDTIGPILQGVGDKINEVLGPKVIGLFNEVKTTLTELWNGPFGAAIKTVVATIAEFSTQYAAAFGGIALGIIGSFVDVVRGAFDIVKNSIKFVVAVLTGDWAGAWEAMKNVFNTVIGTVLRVIANFAPSVALHMAALYNGVKTWIADKLGAIWAGLIAKLETVKKAFFTLYDAVVGHSYVPDMVDGIGQHMARLDGNMVGPALTATKAVAQSFSDLQQHVRGLLDRLFPEIREQLDFNADKNALKAWMDAGKISAEQYEEALKRLAAARNDALYGKDDTLDRVASGGDFKIETNPEEILAGMGDLEKATREKLRNPMLEHAARISEAFAEMTDRVAGSLRGLAGAIKSGDVLDIIVEVANAISEILGAIKGISAATKKGGDAGAGLASAFGGFRALGGPVSAGRAYVVGERGPELFMPRAGGAITSNDNLRRGLGGGGNTYNFNGVMTTDQFWGKIAELDAGAARAGAMGAAKGMQRAASRRIGG